MTSSHYRPGPGDARLAREFRAAPFGHHSPDLQRLLRKFRSEPVRDKYALLTVRPNREWVLVELSGTRGVPLKIHADRVFHSLEEAEWAVFQLRWLRHAGTPLDLDDKAPDEIAP